ncbi:3,9-dihydroxypterocarpan 6A-monooxygenase-like [Durio zibethinus]|uniref:3,9-dihydroxypterocarpan 6A-monooxygenase-like n=1 Tax=Durio zibethinus TaxID=66656 RepID=A0A6P6AXH4_DURZI|nr:3,9-dihydroxypterocarpan 6A-monooxygenase-like [Durio zibethinus]
MDGVLYNYVSLLFVLFICSYIVKTITKKLFSYRTGVRVQHPPSPPALPIIGHLHLLVGSSFSKTIHSLATRHGPVLQLYMGASTCILVSSADFAKEILKTQELNFVSRPEFAYSNYSIYFGSDFTFAPYGTHWRFLKKLCMTRLLSTSQLNQFIPIREQEIMKLLEYLISVSREEESCDLGTPLTTLMNNVICRTAMSTSLSDNNTDEAKKIKELVEEMQVAGEMLCVGDILGPLGKFDLLGYGRKLKKAIGKFDQLVENIMKKHEDQNETGEIRSGQGKDLMDVLLETSNDPSAEVKLTRKDVKAFFLDLFFAGTNTSSVAMKWAIAELINHPQVYKKLRQEIQSVVGHSRLIKESDVQNLPYLQAVVKETLRLHPPTITTIRQSSEDCKINGFYLMAKSRVIINLYSIMRDPSNWNNPDEFIPERFMANSDDLNSNLDFMEMKGQNFDYLPFGSGRRACPGASLALTMIHATVGALVQCFDWKVKDGELVDMREASGFGISMEMANPLVCYPVTKFNPFKKVTDAVDGAAGMSTTKQNHDCKNQEIKSN